MSRGNSGRIVIEIDPATKKELYVALTQNNLTLKDWFILRTSEFLDQNRLNHGYSSTAAEDRAVYSAERK